MFADSLFDYDTGLGDSVLRGGFGEIDWSRGKGMSVLIAMLRGINVGGHHKIKMTELKTLCESLGFAKVQTYIQTGNVVFETKEHGDEKLAKKIGGAIEKKFGFCPEVIVRTAEEMRAIVKKNPFAKEKFDPAKLAVFFLASDPGKAARDAVSRIEANPEVIKPVGSEIYIYFPDGQGRSKLKFNIVEKAINKIAWTARNWNTVEKLLEMAEE
jgi:uncharacterized protein (DUF1697 family)